MQAYATTERIPEKPGLQISLSPYRTQSGGVRVENTRVAHAEGSSEARTAKMLASLVVNGLDEATIALLAQRLASHLEQPQQSSASCLAYTVAARARRTRRIVQDHPLRHRARGTASGQTRRSVDHPYAGGK